MLRVPGSLVTGQVRAYDLLRMFSREGRFTPLGQARGHLPTVSFTPHAGLEPPDNCAQTAAEILRAEPRGLRAA